MTTCIENLDLCKASCCKAIPFILEVPIGHHIEDYYKKHGCELKRISRKLLKVIVPIKCPQLDFENKCRLHGTKDKPYACSALCRETSKDYHMTENCLYA